MGKQETQTEARRQARKASRKGLLLQDKTLTPGLHTRYAQAAARILHFWEESGFAPRAWEDFDVAVSHYLEHIFSEGYPKGFGSDGLAAIQHFVPEVAGKLRHSWKLLKSWQKMEPPVRVLPLSPLVVLAISGACVRLNLPSAAAAFLLAFDAFLRPGELYKLRKSDFVWAGRRAVVSLFGTKTGQRKNAEEMVVVHSDLANYWLQVALRPKKANDLLLDHSPTELRSLFFTMIDHFQLSGYFSMYSFRRGGATWFFLQDQNMEGTLIRGRWSSTSTAKNYLQDAAATLSHLQISYSQRTYFRYLSSFLTAKSQRGVRGR